MASRRASAANMSKPDPRKIRSAEFQDEAISVLSDFLRDKRFPDMVPASRWNSGLTQKDFSSIFRFLFARIEPDYQWSSKSFETEVTNILKNVLRYPFADTVSKMTLMAVGSVKSRPTILGLLVWMVEIIKIYDTVEDDDDDYSLGEPSQAYRDMCSTMSMRLNGMTDEEIDQSIHNSYHEKQVLIEREIEETKSKCDTLKAEIQQLCAAPSALDEAENISYRLQSDIKAFNDKVAELENSAARAFVQLQDRTEEHQQLLANIARQRDRNTELQQRIENQEIKREQAERMAAEQDGLTRMIEELRVRNDADATLFWNKKLELDTVIQEAKKLFREYAMQAQTLGLIPSSASPVAQKYGVKFELVFQHDAKDPRAMCPAAARDPIRDALDRLMTELRVELSSGRSKLAALEEEIRAGNDRVHELQAAKDRLEAILRGQYESRTQLRRQHDHDVEQLQSATLEARTAKGRIEKRARGNQWELENASRKVNADHNRVHAKLRMVDKHTTEYLGNVFTSLRAAKEQVRQELVLLRDEMHGLMLPPPEFDDLPVGGDAEMAEAAVGGAGAGMLDADAAMAVPGPGQAPAPARVETAEEALSREADAFFAAP
ncbi:kinetochore-associated Ndc80 complex subunit ndc80 [Allomyces arbusculus]|nr:kinetochore-associated Ndc80 complex subunit ndc80 [Allomyces arbusculus]